MGELKQESNPHIGAIESEEKHLRLGVKQLICGSLNGIRIRQSLSQSYIPRRGTRWGWWSDPRARAAVEMDREEVREETVVGKARGGKPGHHGS